MDRPTSTNRALFSPVPKSVWLATFTLNLFGMALPLVMLQVFDRILPFAATETLTVLLIGLAAVIPLEMAMKILRAAILNRAATQTSAALSARVTHEVLNATIEQDDVNTPRYHQYLQGPGRLRDILTGTGRLFMIELPFSCVGFGLIWLLAGPLVIVPLSGFVLLYLVASVVRLVHRHNMTAREQADNRRYQLFEHLIAQIGNIKANRFEHGLAERFRAEQSHAARASQRVHFSSNLFHSLAQSINLFFSAAIVCTGAYLVLQRQIGAAELAACTMLNGRASQPLMNAVQHWSSGESYAKVRNNLEEALSLRQRPALPVPFEDLADQPLRVEFENVTLRPTASGRAVLRSFDFAAERGFITLSAGATGNARPFFHALMGQLSPERGAIRINGVDAREMALFRGHHGLAFIDARPDAFEGTLIYNIALSTDAALLDRAYEAAALLGLEADINRLPKGYDSDLRESGILLASRGFLQRINIARALTHRPRLLLMNDAVAAMDPGKRALTAAALQQVARDTLILAHDSSHLLERYSDRSLDIAAPVAGRRAGRRTNPAPKPASDSMGAVA